LIRHPDRSMAYFDRQSYRYQTLRVPGGARPRETYRAVRGFTDRLSRHPARARAVRALLAAHPDLQPVFEGVELADARAVDHTVVSFDRQAARDAAEIGAEPRDVVGTGDGQAAYDAVADLYACTFADVRVRRAEWRWLESRLPRDGEPAVLDVGCGAGALLSALSRHIGRGIGLDVSEEMLAQARRRNAGDAKLVFARGDAARAPFADGSFDVVVSFLSLHYLEWPRAIDEVLRLLAPGGRLLCVDMVSSPVRSRELHRLVAGRAAVTIQHVLHPRFAAGLRALVRDPAWQALERRYPLRPLEQYTELATALGARLEVLTVGAAAKVVAFEATKRVDLVSAAVGDGVAR
jgi:SAM-dependent methyltransferase